MTLTKGAALAFSLAAAGALVQAGVTGSSTVPTASLKTITSRVGSRGTSLVIEATDEPVFFGFYSPDLEGFTGIGHSVEDCLYKAKWGMREFVRLMAERNMNIPLRTEEPMVVIKNSKRGTGSSSAGAMADPADLASSGR